MRKQGSRWNLVRIIILTPMVSWSLQQPICCAEAIAVAMAAAIAPIQQMQRIKTLPLGHQRLHAVNRSMSLKLLLQLP